MKESFRDKIARMLQMIDAEEEDCPSTLSGLTLYDAKNRRLWLFFSRSQNKCRPHVITRVRLDCDEYYCGKCNALVTGMQDMIARQAVKRRRKRKRGRRHNK